ncbi:DNA translocase FtsK [Bartonella sp. HY329]|uniref:DNA translocase FtsK n=1 Tax=unclassified Bartonella TaxID=2645622 RepID=UPI0021C9F5D9|nr:MULTISPECIES: DNA translocase FtsK [unclassified Bartonella]UXM94435.1 DNA translocase FtsK [Bartonella sp. HY329]UXN08759.1 DNA translocase FtsK [Bartonella sp. HY328]
MRNIKSFTFDSYKQTIKTDPAKKPDGNPISKPLLLESLADYPPIWRQAFALTENVRFTRTPDIEIIRKKAESDPAYAEQLQAIYERQQKKPTIIGSDGMIVSEQPIDAPSATGDITDISPILETAKDIITFEATPQVEATSPLVNQSMQIERPESDTMLANKLTTIETPAELETTTPVTSDIQVEKALTEAVKPAPIAISDFAFFEFGPFDITPSNKQNDTATEMEIELESEPQAPQPSITELFRVLECKFSKSGRMEAVEQTNEDAIHVSGNQEAAVANIEAESQLAIAADEFNEDVVDDTKVESETVNEDAAIIDVPASDILEVASSEAAALQSSHAFDSANDNNMDFDAMDCIEKAEGIEKHEKVTDHIVVENPLSDAAFAEQALTADDDIIDMEAQSNENGNIENATNMVEVETIEDDVKADEPDHIPTKSVAITPRHVTDLQSGLRITKQATGHDYTFPSVDLLQPPVYKDGAVISQETLERSAGLLESVLEDFGIKGEIIHVRPGPVVTLYEFEPAPGVKSSRVIGLADDIARSMSAVSARVAVIPGRNVIGIELPNTVRETVFLREIVQSKAFETSEFKLALALGKNIGGEPVIAELAKMPHLLVAGTTGSGKSVAINTMILSLLYHLTPDQCRLIMVDPKMLELSIYDGIPHLLTPVVTDPKKAVTALKWAVREMEDRYRKMAKLGVRNIDGFNERVTEALKNGETIMCTVQAGFDKETGELLYNEEAMDLNPLPYIVIIVDEMADLMMVAGKEIEGAIQRLAQMARAAGIHLIMATQRPSVDVITGTIKANFPTRISFQVTSKIDSRTILGEQGAETLLGQGDMLHMAGGGRIVRVHGAFVSDSEVEHIVSHLKTQGTPDYLATVTDSEEDEPEDDSDNIAELVANAGDDAEELYVQGVKVVMRDKKCSTSYIQRRLGIGYNKAASLVERMEKEGLVGAANHVGKREILINNH